MFRNRTVPILFLALVVCSAMVFADSYRDVGQVGEHLRKVAAANKDLVTFGNIGTSVGGREIWYVRVAAKGAVAPDKRPAVFIGANIEGVRLLATEAALRTLDYLVAGGEEVDELLKTRTFYIAPVLNPDLMARMQDKLVTGSLLNLSKVNEDRDLATNEDGPDDLDGDGYITQMRVKDPEGKYIIHPADARFMKRADASKGEMGEYRLLPEGIDNDGDGEFNEDGPGGVVINRNFPHDFKHFVNANGIWSVSEPETKAIVDFVLGHPNIALAYTFGSESNLLNLKRGKGKEVSASSTVKVPRSYARFLGLDTDTEYKISDLVKILNDSGVMGGQTVTVEMIGQMMGGGPAMSLSQKDFAVYQKISKDYIKMVEDAGIDSEDRKPKPVMGDGSYVTWAYYQQGLISFSVDLWGITPPKKEEKKEKSLTAADLKKMSNEEFLALGEEEINAFIKSVGMEDDLTAAKLIEAVESGKASPAQMAGMMDKKQEKVEKAGDKPKTAYILDWAAENLDNKGYTEWQEFDHPTLGKVEIGGKHPLVGVNPSCDVGMTVLDDNVKFAVNLAGKLAEIKLAHAKAEAVADGLYEITVFVENKGSFPTAMAQGITNGQVKPVRVRLSLDKEAIIDGSPVGRVASIAGNGRSQKLRWLVKAKKGSSITLTAETEKAGNDSVKLELK
jgi:hypothetical protein